MRLLAVVVLLFPVLALLLPGKATATPPEAASGRMVLVEEKGFAGRSHSTKSVILLTSDGRVPAPGALWDRVRACLPLWLAKRLLPPEPEQEHGSVGQ
jgi:hypothetical protein